ncbi:MAG: 3-deoxy-manno-octulosonate cytidylyltransferase [Tissierellales bacterium]|nr:3-deoxy-manno-octulosonate cytidylyltransferase [Tissierellales bacterium]
MKKNIIGIIPARYQSTRFPGKPLISLLGKPMIIWVVELSAKALGKNNVYVATEDERIKKIVEKYGFNAIMTSHKHATGTDRLAEVAENINANIYINIQGDEPTIDPISIIKICKEKIKHPREVINAMTNLSQEEDPSNINIPKVIFTEDMRMIYMSRLPIPGFKNPSTKPIKYYKQVCIYAFSRNQLKKFAKIGRKSKLEIYEDIEILRFLDMNIPIRMVDINIESFAIDVKEDIARVEKKLIEIHKISEEK